MARYYLAKLNIIENIFTEDMQRIKMELIPQRVLSFKNDTLFYTVGHKIDGESRAKWTFSDVEQMSSNIISGNIAKQEEVTRFEIREGKSVKSVANDAKLVKFFYLIGEELLLIQSNSGINYADSIIIFRQLLLLNDDLHLIGDIKINVLSNQSKAIEELISKPVRKITLKYHVPNDPKTLNTISDILLDAHAQKGKFEIQNPDGLKATEHGKLSRVFSNIISITKKGYGEWSAKVGSKKHPKTLSSEEYPITKNVSDDSLKDGVSVTKVVKEMKDRVEETSGDDK
ncbi:hypothetical protein JK163_01260 [Levilactobacillus brevis]|uniref:hypothetical protein n=1 Tax=Levilactobacillus brevis TaxID=1580 RepID=UPI001BACE793|nr:hypothetical protein [Levilactobacillus brevis]MBS1004949.1 hypothetical protein [Levilactobacillus brevis]